MQAFVEVTFGFPVAVGIVLGIRMAADRTVVGGIAAVSGVYVNLKVADLTRFGAGRYRQYGNNDKEQSFHGQSIIRVYILPLMSLNTTLPL